jgi:UDP-N-acetylmuramyl pentapeptide phosphotransferase/UDP-N-acetylglucosamine-1-phosphate transferase
MEPEIGGILLLPVIAALVKLLVDRGVVSKDQAPLANAALTTLAFALIQAVDMRPEVAPAVASGLQLVAMFLAVAGTYSTGRFAFERLVLGKRSVRVFVDVDELLPGNFDPDVIEN